MFTANEGILDRALRIALGAVLLYLVLGGAITGTLGVVIAALAVLPLLTGIIGWCPLYSLLGLSTNGARK